MAGFFQTRERRALVVFLLLAGVFVAGLLLAERRKSAVSAGPDLVAVLRQLAAEVI